MSLLKKIGAILKSAIQQPRTNKFYKEQPVGAGYYSLRENISKSGVRYTKLVKRDRSREKRLNF